LIVVIGEGRKNVKEIIMEIKKTRKGIRAKGNKYYISNDWHIFINNKLAFSIWGVRDGKTIIKQIISLTEEEHNDIVNIFEQSNIFGSKKYWFGINNYIHIVFEKAVIELNLNMIGN
jgi:hypothetical protein